MPGFACDRLGAHRLFVTVHLQDVGVKLPISYRGKRAV